MAKTKQFRKKRSNKRSTKRKMMKGGMPIFNILLALLALGLTPVNAYSRANVKSAAVGVGLGVAASSARNAVKGVNQKLEDQNKIYRDNGGAFAVNKQITISWGDLTKKIGIEEAMKLIGRTGFLSGAPSTFEIVSVKYTDDEKYENMLKTLGIEEKQITEQDKNTLDAVEQSLESK